MKSSWFVRTVFLGLALFGIVVPLRAEDPLSRREWTVNGVVREALVHLPPNAEKTPAPIVFIYHGHNGTMQAIAKNFRFHELWPEAIVVYPQGLNTTSSRDPEGLQAGWQRIAGQDKDRDLHLFDAILASLKRDYQVDDNRIYATGHSNGGAFTYLLWVTRGDVLAALAPSGSVLLLPEEQAVSSLTPRPLLHVAGKMDETVSFERQEKTMDLVRKVNQCSAGAPGESEHCTLYPSKLEAPVITYIHPGAHGFPRHAAPVIQRFFQAHARR